MDGLNLCEPDASGRRRPIAKEGSNFTIETGTVIVAIGQSPNPLIRHTTPGLDCQSWGGIIVDEDSMKTSKMVFMQVEMLLLVQQQLS